MRNILCAVDLAEPAPRVLAYGAGLARMYGAPLLLVHVFNPPLPLRLALPQYAGDLLDSSARTGLMEDLEQLAEPMREQGLTVRCLVREGRPARELARAARSKEADLVVMGTHGRAGMGRLVLGSVAEETIRTAPCPVLTLPPEGEGSDAEAEPGPESFRRILCPVDHSPDSLAALRTATAIAERVQGIVRLLHVVEWFAPRQLAAYRFLTSSQVPDSVLGDARARLDAIVPTSTSCGFETDVVVADRPYTAILQAASRQPSDLIVLGVRGRGAPGPFAGSTTNRVLRQAPCPVLTVAAEPETEH